MWTNPATRPRKVVPLMLGEEGVGGGEQTEMSRVTRTPYGYSSPVICLQYLSRLDRALQSRWESLLSGLRASLLRPERCYPEESM
jgi:hypothetical protein